VLLSLLPPSHGWGAETGLAVTRILDGDTLEVEGPRIVRLAGLLAPKEKEPGSAAATEGLADLVAGRRLILEPETPDTDRHGRLIAQVFLEDGTWLQGEILGRGLARVQTLADARARAAGMLDRERDARKAGRGIWALGTYRIRSSAAASLTREAGTFQLVEGRIVSAAKVKGTVYLNFDEDWRTDFTAVIGREGLKRFKAARLDPLTLQGRLVRVRGWLGLRNGPTIDLGHPEQIEILE
jgi:endonuclease YncB( thermonuclease family)